MSRRLRDEFERLYNPLTKKHRNINLDKYLFLYLNRYLDILDAVEDDNLNIENNGFEETDIPPPSEIEIPEREKVPLVFKQYYY